MWNEQKRRLETQLSPGETLLWSGPPRRGLLLRSADLYIIPFSLLWCGFAIFWNAGVWSSNAPVFFRLWGLPFLIVGIYVVIGRFFVDAWQRAKTYYGVTNERVIITSGLFSSNIKSLNLATLSDVSLSEKSDRSGTITFGPIGSGWTANFPFAVNKDAPVYPILDSIPEAKSVYEIIRNAQRAAK